MPEIKSTKIERTCQRCKHAFLINPSEVKKGGGKYCSRQCYRAPTIQFTCPTCNTRFERKDWEVRNNLFVIACSQKCVIIEMKKQAEARHQDKGAKTCPDCKHEKPLADFHLSKRERSGRTVYCRVCQSQRSKKYKSDGNTRRAKVKAELVLRLGNKCAHCGVENLPICCYEFHHRDGGTKEFTVSTYLAQRAWDIDAEIAKCDLLCSYCHNLEHALYSNKPATAYV